MRLLEKLSDDKSQTNDTRTDAEMLLKIILIFNFITLLHFGSTFSEKLNLFRNG
jgi:hypothetical protein